MRSFIVKKGKVSGMLTDVAVGGVLCDCFGEQICLSLIGLELEELV